MKTPREILLRQHRDAAPKLDAIRGGVVAAISPPPPAEPLSWQDVLRSLRWHLAGWSVAWVVVMVLNLHHSPSAVAMTAGDKAPPPQQIWASLRERRRLLLEETEVPAVQMPTVPGRRSEIEPKQAVV
ncbi:MAG TPA: hypothetical protein VK731_05220 [Candidatus Cybelea sp.]|jgi:hypothetical protein|nr:hypothetical protein [Candidatus Cybelea sp.]